jgi:ABC-type nitrate/sulfonate/bicarbonate transport system substrate-binding protein
VAPATYQIETYQKGQKVVSTMGIMNRNAINVVMHEDVAREKGITEKSPLTDKIKALKGRKLSGVAVGSFSYEMPTYYLLKAAIDPKKDVELINRTRPTSSCHRQYTFTDISRPVIVFRIPGAA